MLNKLLKKKYIFLGLLLIVLAMIFIFFYINKKTNEYSPKVLVIYKYGTNNYQDIYQNFKQSYILNAEVLAIDDTKISTQDLSSFNIIYPDNSLITSSNINYIKDKLINYVSTGGNLFLENELSSSFNSEFTGISNYTTYNKKNYTFTYPEVSYNLKELQLVVKNYLDNFIEYRKDSFMPFNKATLTSAKSIADIDNGSIMAINKYNSGYVLSSSTLLPNDKLITGFDLTAKDTSQKYFDYSFASINYIIRNEFLAFSLKEKDGYVLKKVFGPYGRPAMAWQNHYEALSSIKNKEAIDWIDLLKNYNEIPSFSLVRGAYDWGKWKSDISLHINQGSSSSPIFEGETNNSFYSSGQRLEGKNDYLLFGDYPEYKSLSESISLPQRAYPTVVDYNNDGNNDLVVGAPNGTLYLVKNIGSSSKPVFDDKSDLKTTTVGSYASPTIYDINKDGLFDLVVGNGNGYINVFINDGKLGLPSFLEPIKLRSNGKEIKVDKYSTPSIGNIIGNDIDDMIIGSASGAVVIYKNSPKGYIYSGVLLKDNIDKFSAPTICDWNGDGKNDILVGDNSGTIKIFLNKDGNFIFSGTAEGKNTNSSGNKSLLSGHNSVPVVTDWNNDGIQDLIVGQLEFGVSYSIDGKFFKYKDELKEILTYAKSHGISIYPHFLTHKYKTPEQEKIELSLQKKSFDFYNLSWLVGGVNQHTWRTNELNSQQTLKSELSSGLWWNFGFNPPNQPDLPRDGKEFLWSVPFLLSNGENTNNFIAFTPSPNLFKYPNVYNSFIQFDMPITYFEHIEYSFTTKPEMLEKLKQMSIFLDNARKKGEYNFVTEEQMAKSFINTFYTKANISKNNETLNIVQNTNSVPSLAGEYKGALGIKLERGEKYKDAAISTTSQIHYEKDDDLYFALNKNTKIFFNKSYKNEFHIVRSNVPLKINNLFGTTIIKPQEWGMQQIKIYSPKELSIKGENLKIEQEGNYYTITHYGYPVKISIK